MDKYDQNPHRYDDLLKMPYPYPTLRKRMSMTMRGAQFAPFAALTGYDKAVDETARLTTKKKELSDHEQHLLDIKLHDLRQYLDEHPEIEVTYFEPDLKKEGGTYLTYKGCLKKIDEIKCSLVFEDGQEIEIEDILFLESEYFSF